MHQRGSPTRRVLRAHSLALDSAGRLYVADRSNSRIQIFESPGNI